MLQPSVTLEWQTHPQATLTWGWMFHAKLPFWAYLSLLKLSKPSKAARNTFPKKNLQEVLPWAEAVGLRGLWHFLNMGLLRQAGLAQT